MSLMLRAALLCSLVVCPWMAAGEAPDVDAAIQKLLELDPAVLAEKLEAMREQATVKDAESKTLLEKAAAREAEAAADKAFLDAIYAGLKALSMPMAMEPASDEAMMGDTVMADADGDATDSTDASEAAAPTVTFDDHIMPIFRARCASCHNQDRARGGLAVDTIAAVLDGGSSGKVLEAGNPDASRLFRLVLQTDEPIMPPSGDPLSPEQLDLIRVWIEQGMPENAGSQVMVAKAIEVSGDVFTAARIVDGPPPMPEVSMPAPVVQAHRGVVARAIAASPRAALLAVGSERQVLLYDLESFALLGALPFPEGEIFTLTFSLNGELLLAGGGREGDSGIAVLWNVRSAERVGEYGQAYDTILAADISPDHRMLALGGPNRRVRTYSVADGSERFTLESHTDWIYSVRFTPDGEVLATADRAGNLFLWQAANGRPVEQLRGHNGAINDLAYSADSKILASAGEDGTIQLWDTWAYSRIRSINAHSGPVLSLDFSTGGEIVSSGVDGHIKRWDLGGGNTGNYEQLGDWAYQARFAGDDQIVIGGDWHGQIIAWDRESGERRAVLNTFAEEPEVTTVAKADEEPAS